MATKAIVRCDDGGQARRAPDQRICRSVVYFRFRAIDAISGHQKKRSRHLVGFRRKGFGFGVALVAALMLVLQTVAGAVALGQGTPPLDIFGNPLCITSASGHTAPAKSEHPALTECCTLGCNVVSVVAVTPPDGTGLLLGRQLETSIVFMALRPDASIAPEHDPGNPRAPPLV